MESNWRMNVWRYGLAKGPVTLLARFRPPFQAYLLAQHGHFNSVYFLYTFPAPGQLPVLVFASNFVTRPHFPWQWLVEPD